jgi:hypothetical protein
MRKITLICSLHRENGLCTADELLRILRVIDPEVIFGEVTQSDRCFYDPRSLEGKAVTRFLAWKSSCKLVPVDRYDVPPNLRAVSGAVFDFVEEASEEYQQLLEQRHHGTNLKGFAYLNSADLTRHMTRMAEIEDETIKSSGNPDLVRGLTTWRQVTRGRENAMVTNIDRYCTENVFDQGVFLVGAAHRSGLGKIIEEFSIANDARIAWKIDL